MKLGGPNKWMNREGEGTNRQGAVASLRFISVVGNGHAPVADIDSNDFGRALNLEKHLGDKFGVRARLPRAPEPSAGIRQRGNDASNPAIEPRCQARESST